MKVCLYAGDMNIIRRDKKYVEKQKFNFLGNKMVKPFFSSPNVL